MSKVLRSFVMGVLVGAILMVSTYGVASTVNQYLLERADYPVYVNNELYVPGELDLPILKYRGYTYAPLRAVSELLGVHIDWNAELGRVEITREKAPVFRNVTVTGGQGVYTVTGEARVFEATFQYEVSDGHFVHMAGFMTTSNGAPEWGTFTLEVNVAAEDLPVNGTLTLFLYEESAADGSVINQQAVVLETFPSAQNPTENAAFRNIAITGTQGVYAITGEARVYEATLQYEVSDGHVVFMEGFLTASAAAPDWGSFTLDVNISPTDLPANGTLTLFLFEESANDGSAINELPIVLEIFP